MNKIILTLMFLTVSTTISPRSHDTLKYKVSEIHCLKEEIINKLDEIYKNYNSITDDNFNDELWDFKK